MSYTADADLVGIMPERTLVALSADDPMAGIPDWAVVAEARAYADAQVDARLRQRYSLPLASVPRELRDWALALARRWLYERRLDGTELPAGVLTAAQEALKALDAVRDGKLSLAVGDGDQSPAPETGRVRVVGPERRFNTDLMSRY
jgi:phage gp36-like protein